MKLLPVALNLEGKRCLVVGGGAVARRKIESLLECGALVRVVAPELDEAFLNRVEHTARLFETGDCAGSALVFACTDSAAVNAAVAEEAKSLGVWCNLADDATASDFHGAAVVRRGDISIGITTAGGSPALAKHLKEKVQESVGEEYAELLELMSERRELMQKALENQSERAAIWHAILGSDALEYLRQERRAEAEVLIDNLINGEE